ncbi:hypothetical protein DFP83_10129 [Idiomarina fontislapidosi]|uniref:Uncharacterized protein n=1 Tax=Idiomarina fontislapidosi TaxID=263723 RepID=A0A432YAP0_9GAMM|nr:hypothetical protein [Idiomarina fontislapidosi]PYE35155.1 hypothetical protein DFP83_10129 [Idiomarina fontislapidosi]RUO58050.1 hypothetical protein CWE25_00160 [Idiomarina fontislapidosi]|tara:strand:+ start:7299 stop:8045 length:747 start_codon:yes stop_codon:yes gene_type:complete
MANCLIKPAIFAVCGWVALSSSSATANELTLLNRYQQQTTSDGVAVKAEQDLPAQVDQKACRLLLSKPQRLQLKAELSETLGFEIADNVSFFAGRIDNEKLWTADGWQHCSGNVVVENKALNLAALAVRAAWQMQGQLDQTQLKQLLQLSLSESYSSADAVALIAHLAPEPRQFAYLQQNLQPEQLTLDTAKYSAARLYFNQQDYGQSITIASTCESIDCQRLRVQAEQKKEQQDADKAFDLDSYFNP